MTDLHFGDDLSDHPSSEEIAAYLNGALAPAARDVLEEHLVKCRACRRDVTSARRLLRQGSPNRILWLVPAAAAAVLLFVVISRLPGPSPSGEEPLRSEKGVDRSNAPPTIRAVAPPNGATIEPDAVVFTWRSQPGLPLYQLNLTDGGGRAVWSGETTDTTLTLPASITLDRRRTYYWTVDALAADGRSLTTRTQRFSTAR